MKFRINPPLVMSLSLPEKSENKRKNICDDVEYSQTFEHRALLENLECPICLEIAFPPVKQCMNGHILCCECSSKCKSCPSCRVKLGNIRALFIEKLAAKFQWKCRYEKDGCQKMLGYLKATDHFKFCEYRTTACCPIPSCSKMLIMKEKYILSHLEQDHKLVSLNLENISTKSGSLLQMNVNYGVVNKKQMITNQSLIKYKEKNIVVVMTQTSSHIGFSIVCLANRQQTKGMYVQICIVDKYERKFTFSEPLKSICEQYDMKSKVDACSIPDVNWQSFFMIPRCQLYDLFEMEKCEEDTKTRLRYRIRLSTDKNDQL